VSGLRERKKLATRTALADAALRLCVANGLDGVTVEQVANDAGVSLRTFFNYFSSKEEAVVAGDGATAAAFVQAFAARPPEEPVLRALHAALVDVVPERIDPERVAQMRVLRRTPALLPHQVAAFVAQERELAAAVAARLGLDPAADLYPMMFAATVMATLRVVISWWVDAAERPELSDLIGVMIDRLDAGFATAHPNPDPDPVQA
jgi:AcrR family transcriptional regulator